jgi:hypothetical protein
MFLASAIDISRDDRAGREFVTPAAIALHYTLSEGANADGRIIFKRYQANVSRY